MPNQHRQLAAILFTDIVGYTALMQENEPKAVALIKHYNAALNERVGLHNGKVLNYYGDGSLCSFPSVTEAMSCAVELQKELQTEPKVPLRIGLHVGEVFFENEKALGDGVNVASRIQSLGQANTIFFSKEIFDKIRNQPEFKSVSIGFFEFKNVDQPMEVFALANEGLNIPKRETLEGKLKTNLTKNKKTVRRRIITTSSLVLLLLAGFFIYSMFFKKPGFTGHEKSIAVLPFTNMSSDKENEYFSDGMTEEITTQLSKITDLKVISRSSAMLYKDSKKSIKQIAKELDVASILEGSVQKTGGQIRITAQLIDANTQQHIWADKWDRSFNDIFAIQSEVAEEIAYQLNVKLTKEEKKKIEQIPTNNSEAYQYYLQGNSIHEKFYETRKLEYYTTSKSLFEKALILDSNYALAHAAIADLYNTYTNFIEKDSTLLQLQIKEIEKAYSLDSSLDYVNYTRGTILNSTLRIPEESYKYFRRAFEINPNNPVNLYGLATILRSLGLHDEALVLLKRTVNLDPLTAANFVELAHTEIFLYKLDDAIKDFQISLQLEPDYFSAMDGLTLVYSLQNKMELANEMFKKAEKLRPKTQKGGIRIAYYYAKSGIKNKALEITQGLRVYLALDMKEDALKHISTQLSGMTSTPTLYNDYLSFKNHLPHNDFDLIRNNPLFLELLEKKRVQYENNKKKFSIAGILN